MVKNRMCTRCVLDTTVPNIRFDENGVCNYCKIHDLLEKQHPLGKASQKQFENLVKEIKKESKNRKYDCIIGVSGGTDSTYMLYIAKKYKLRALAVHFDNGWDSEIAVHNIEQAISKLNFELETYVVDWEEFKDLQIAFLKSSTPDLEQPTDMAIKAVLYKTALKEGVKYIFSGHNFRTEGKVPLTWGYSDSRYLRYIHKRFGKLKKLVTYPAFSYAQLFYWSTVKGIKQIRPLYYLGFNKNEVVELLKRELDWKEYGDKHCESIYTHYIQTYILPKKFGIDKRKIHFSAQVRSGLMTREEALELLKQPPISTEAAEEETEYVLKKLGLSRKEFERIMSLPPKTFMDYPNNLKILIRYKWLIKLLYRFISPSTPAFIYTLDYWN